jgi:hypothetical protein
MDPQVTDLPGSKLRQKMEELSNMEILLTPELRQMAHLQFTYGESIKLRTNLATI